MEYGTQKGYGLYCQGDDDDVHDDEIVLISNENFVIKILNISALVHCYNNIYSKIFVYLDENLSTLYCLVNILCALFSRQFT